MHILCLDSSVKIRNKRGFAHFPLSFPQQKLETMNIKVNIFMVVGIYRRRSSWYAEKKGEVPMEFEIEQGVLTAYTGPGGRVTVPEGGTEIGEGAFAHCGALTSVTVWEGVQTIGARSFFRCTHLRWVMLPHGLTELGAEAFSGCTHMMSVKLPEGLRCIGTEAFAYCRGLDSVTVPDSVESVGEHVFRGCGNLRELRVSEHWKAAHPDLYARLTDRK